MIKKLLSSPVVKILFVFILIILILFMFPSTQAFADDVLGLFRVQQVIALPINPIYMEKINNDQIFIDSLMQFVSETTLVIDEQEEPVIVQTVEEANKMIGFESRMPSEMIPTQITTFDSVSMIMTINRMKAQNIIDILGRSDLILPEEIDGAEILINIPAAVRVDFGYCDISCITFSQMPSLTAEIPDNVNMSEIIEIGLKVTGRNDNEAEEFAKSFDWRTTLLIPVPDDTTSYQDVYVDGVNGKLIQNVMQPEKGYLLIWIKNGTTYSINGSGADKTFAIKIANSLQ